MFRKAKKTEIMLCEKNFAALMFALKALAQLDAQAHVLRSTIRGEGRHIYNIEIEFQTLCYNSDGSIQGDRRFVVCVSFILLDGRQCVDGEVRIQARSFWLPGDLVFLYRKNEPYFTFPDTTMALALYRGLVKRIPSESAAA